MTREEPGHHRSNAVHSDAGRRARRQRGGGAIQPVIDFRVRLKVADGGESGAYSERVAGESASLVDRAAWRNLGHNVAASAVCGDGESTTDYFAERGDIGRKSVELLGTAGGHPEAGHHFVED